MRLRIDHMQVTAAAKAGISVATARRIEHDPRPPSTKRGSRPYRTRPDPLAGHWDEVVVPLLQAAPGLRPVTILGELARRYPEQIGPSVRRTLERRIAAWKALHGPARDVIFPQVQEPGRLRLRRARPCPAIGIGGSLAAPPLPHHRAYGSVHGGSTVIRWRMPAKEGRPSAANVALDRAMLRRRAGAIAPGTRERWPRSAPQADGARPSLQQLPRTGSVRLRHWSQAMARSRRRDPPVQSAAAPTASGRSRSSRPSPSGSWRDAVTILARGVDAASSAASVPGPAP